MMSNPPLQDPDWLDYDFTVKVDSHSYWLSEYGRAAKPTDRACFS